MPDAEAIAYVLEQAPTTPAAASPRSQVSKSLIQLTRREDEIAALVAQGLSNKQIAAKLVVSERTVESHIWNILNKLGFNSRVQIASWAATEQPLASAPKG
jgi:DNA-binding NarL/FixJ family response regulator